MKTLNRQRDHDLAMGDVARSSDRCAARMCRAACRRAGPRCPRGDFLVQKPPTAQKFSFGHIGVNAVVFNIPPRDTTKENGHIESLDTHVTPRSLYLTQLRERLGES